MLCCVNLQIYCQQDSMDVNCGGVNKLGVSLHDINRDGKVFGNER